MNEELEGWMVGKAAVRVIARECVSREERKKSAVCTGAEEERKRKRRWG